MGARPSGRVFFLQKILRIKNFYLYLTKIKAMEPKEFTLRLAETINEKTLSTLVMDDESNTIRFGGESIAPENVSKYQELKGVAEKVLEQLKGAGYIHSKVAKDPILSRLKHSNFKLVGGAVLDLWEGRKPKDYDFLKLNLNKLPDAVLVDSSKTADTYMVNDIKIQVLRTSIKDFDFTVSRNCIEDYNLTYLRYSHIDSFSTKLHECSSYKNKILVPASYSRKGAINALLRWPHWRDKGFRLTDNTYRSLLFAASGSKDQNTKS
jgi:hypothetical protein